MGKAYALYLASHGASIVVNDIGGAVDGSVFTSTISPADIVVQEIKASGGLAVSDKHSVTTEANSIIQTALNTFGRIDIIINNAGIIRDKSFLKLTDSDWVSDLFYNRFKGFSY